MQISISEENEVGDIGYSQFQLIVQVASQHKSKGLRPFIRHFGQTQPGGCIDLADLVIGGAVVGAGYDIDHRGGAQLVQLLTSLVLLHLVG